MRATVQATGLYAMVPQLLSQSACTLVCAAHALASRVFPVPGAPYRSTPTGHKEKQMYTSSWPPSKTWEFMNYNTLTALL